MRNKGCGLRIFMHEPSHDDVTHFLRQQRHAPLSYAEVGASRTTPPCGYRVNHHRTRLGSGLACFNTACTALRSWQMFPGDWVTLYWPTTPIEVGAEIAVLAHWGRLWWLNACRMVYVMDEASSPRRFGFAYGTLPAHAARGEERFSIEWDEEDTVWYDLFAFSQPNHVLTRIGYPFMRRTQQRFAAQSLAAMVRACQRSG